MASGYTHTHTCHDLAEKHCHEAQINVILTRGEYFWGWLTVRIGHVSHMQKKLDRILMKKRHVIIIHNITQN